MKSVLFLNASLNRWRKFLLENYFNALETFYVTRYMLIVVVINMSKLKIMLQD